VWRDGPRPNRGCCEFADGVRSRIGNSPPTGDHRFLVNVDSAAAGVHHLHRPPPATRRAGECYRVRVYLACSSSLIGWGQQFGGLGRSTRVHFVPGSIAPVTLDLCPARIAPPRLPLSFLRGWAAAHEHFVRGSKPRSGSPTLAKTEFCGPQAANSFLRGVEGHRRFARPCLLILQRVCDRLICAHGLSLRPHGRKALFA
jgi:hypothetical protein